MGSLQLAIASMTRLRVTLGVVVAAFVAPPTAVHAATFAYVPNSGSSDVSVIDTTAGTVTATIPVAATPTSVTVDASGSRVYVASATNPAGATVSVIDTATNTVIATPVVCNDNNPFYGRTVALAIPLAGTRVYAGCPYHARIDVIDTATNTFAGSHGSFQFYDFLFGMGVNAAGTRLYTADDPDLTYRGRVHTLDASTFATLATADVDRGNPYTIIGSDVVVEQAGTRVYFTYPTDPKLGVVDTASNGFTAISTGSGTIGIALRPAADRLYATLADGSVAVIDTSSNAVLATIPVGGRPLGIDLTPDGSRLYVAKADDDAVAVIDTGTNTVVGTIAVGDAPVARGRFLALVSATCGDGVVSAGEGCDDGDQNGSAGSCCAADCTPQPDTDADGVCDPLDSCANVAHAQDFLAQPDPTLVLRRRSSVPGAPFDHVSFGGELTLPPGRTFANLDPRADGARFALVSDGTQLVVDAVLPAGAFGGRGTRGWESNGAGLTWRYRDRTGFPIGGIDRLLITDRSRSGARRVRVRASGLASVDGASPPDGVLIVLGGPASAANGECGELAYERTVDCRFAGHGSSRWVCEK